MMNTMEISGYHAVIQYDPEIEQFRGEFIGLNGGADFYALDIESLKKEGDISLKVFIDACQKRGIEPKKTIQENSMCEFHLHFMKTSLALRWPTGKALISGLLKRWIRLFSQAPHPPIRTRLNIDRLKSSETHEKVKDISKIMITTQAD